MNAKGRSWKATCVAVVFTVMLFPTASPRANVTINTIYDLLLGTAVGVLRDIGPSAYGSGYFNNSYSAWNIVGQRSKQSSVSERIGYSFHDSSNVDCATFWVYHVRYRRPTAGIQFPVGSACTSVPAGWVQEDYKVTNYRICEGIDDYLDYASILTLSHAHQQGTGYWQYYTQTAIEVVPDHVEGTGAFFSNCYTIKWNP